MCKYQAQLEQDVEKARERINRDLCKKISWQMRISHADIKITILNKTEK